MNYSCTRESVEVEEGGVVAADETHNYNSNCATKNMQYSRCAILILFDFFAKIEIRN